MPGLVLLLALLSVTSLGSLKTAAPTAAGAPDAEKPFVPAEQLGLIQTGEEGRTCGTVDSAPAGVK